MSTARKELFHLADLVRTSGDDTVVILNQRGHAEPVAMVREARLAYLEAREAAADKAETRPFKVAGSLSTDAGDQAVEDLLRELRREWTLRPRTQTRTGRSRRQTR